MLMADVVQPVNACSIQGESCDASASDKDRSHVDGSTVDTRGSPPSSYTEENPDANSSSHAVESAESEGNLQKARQVRDSLSVQHVFTATECTYIEFMLDDMATYAANHQCCGPYTVDATELRTKYFFGFGYTYGWGQRGREAILPLGSVDPIPAWIEACVIWPLVQKGVCPYGWINSAVVNDYKAGGSIVAHVDPPQLFERPILSCSFFDPGHLVFDASFDRERSRAPVHKQHLPRGSVLKMGGFAANDVTHGMRPEDMTGSRRVSIVLRHVKDTAPRLYRETPMNKTESSNLVRSVQGRWRDVPSHYIYIVLGLRVMVYRTVNEPEMSGDKDDAKAACKKASASSPNSKDDAAPLDVVDFKLNATWDLQLTQYGLVCNNTFLDDNGVEDGKAFWRKRHDVQSAKNLKDGIMWIRLEDDMSALFDTIARR